MDYANLKLELQRAYQNALDAARSGTWPQLNRVLRYCRRLEKALRELAWSPVVAWAGSVTAIGLTNAVLNRVAWRTAVKRSAAIIATAVVVSSTIIRRRRRRLIIPVMMSADVHVQPWHVDIDLCVDRASPNCGDATKAQRKRGLYNIPHGTILLIFHR
jgi:hypothetical protein